jgi:hypothetical protein
MGRMRRCSTAHYARHRAHGAGRLACRPLPSSPSRNPEPHRGRSNSALIPAGSARPIGRRFIGAAARDGWCPASHRRCIDAARARAGPRSSADHQAREHAAVVSLRQGRRNNAYRTENRMCEGDSVSCGDTLSRRTTTREPVARRLSHFVYHCRVKLDVALPLRGDAVVVRIVDARRHRRDVAARRRSVSVGRPGPRRVAAPAHEGSADRRGRRRHGECLQCSRGPRLHVRGSPAVALVVPR